MVLAIMNKKLKQTINILAKVIMKVIVKGMDSLYTYLESFLGGFLGGSLDDTDSDGLFHVSDGESSKRRIVSEGFA